MTTPDHHPVPYWRLGAFYWFYFASLGALLPFWALYLQSLGYGPAAIGELMATLMATRIVAPNLWAWIADHYGKRMVIVRQASLAGLLCFAGVLFGDTYLWLALVMTAFSFFWNASLPQFEATTFAHLGKHSHRYSQIRLWGSVGFIVAVIGIGKLLEYQSLAIVPWLVLGLFLAIWLVSLSVPDCPLPQTQPAHVPLASVLKRGPVVALFVACFLMQASHGAYYTFYSVYLEQHGYARSLIGQLWALGVAAEVGLFMLMHRLLVRYTLRLLLMASLALAALRWSLIAYFPEYLPVLVAAQTLHAASFALYHAAAIQLVHNYFTGRLQGRGQALYTSLSFGLGGAVGTLASGYIWTGLGPGYSYAFSALLCLLGLYVTWRWLACEWRQSLPPQTT